VLRARRLSAGRQLAPHAQPLTLARGLSLGLDPRPPIASVVWSIGWSVGRSVCRTEGTGIGGTKYSETGEVGFAGAARGSDFTSLSALP